MSRFLVLLGMAVTAIPARAQIMQITSGATGGTYGAYAGLTFTTPAGGPWSNITFNFYATPAMGSAPASTPEAVGTAFLLTQVYNGTPSNLSSSAPGYVASSISISGGVYIFPPSVVLNPNTQYWVYENGLLPSITGGPPPPIDNYEALTATANFVQIPSRAGFFNYTLGGTTSTAPTISGMENAASNIAPGLPNAGIAQGSIFIVQGGNLGPANIFIATSAFQSTTLSNTSVTVTVGGTTVNALMYYTSATQLAALLPSNTPAGTGTLMVTYNGQTSTPAPITVVSNNLGIFSIDSTGAGPGIVTYPDYSLVSAAKSANCGGPSTACGAANPGDVLTIWATGLGPVNGSDAAGAGLGQNMPDIPLTLWIGGVQAPVLFQGRGCCIGEDQIAFTVPNNVPTGCAVPLVVQIGNEISNSTAIPVANGGRTCTPNNAAYAAANLAQAVLAGPITSGNIKLFHSSDGNGKFEDDGKAQFQRLTFAPRTQPFVVSWVDDPPAGTCLVYNNINQSLNVPATGAVSLDAGSTITLTGPGGSVSLPEQPHATAFNATGTFLVPGTYTVTGTGGADVGPFSATFTIPALPTLTSPVNGVATRANGITVTWTGGSGNIAMDIYGCTDSTCNNGASAVCIAPASPGTFTIPPSVLLAFPASTSAGFVFSTELNAPFAATGLNLGAISVYRYSVAGFGYGWGSGSFTLK